MEVSSREKEMDGEDLFTLHCWREVCGAERSRNERSNIHGQTNRNAEMSEKRRDVQNIAFSLHLQ